MKVCIYGAGAIGAHLGGYLARTELDVSLIARGPHLEAMRRDGLTVVTAGESFTVRPRVSNDARELGPQDYVIVTLKAHQTHGVVDALRPLMGSETTVVTTQNGVPWWYFYKLAGPWGERPIECVDPGGVQWSGIGPERVIHSVIYVAAEVIEPGTVRHEDGDSYPLGEPDGSRSQRVLRLSRAIVAAGLRSPVRGAIRNEIWVKLWGNLSFNPVSVLTHATLAGIGRAPGAIELVHRMMLEGQAVAEALGVKFPVDVERRIAGAIAVGEHKTSMLQDLERGRSMEIDALVAAVAELGDRVGVDTPYVDAVLALVRLRATTAGLYPPA
ncbi:MAG: 2-dehydropantoate 2-reductase [Alphaproteobacteria bacterium]|nr:2-dehydropantoate 2-reductase [Alphaproteobacteria bacterium]